jgi:hypothetical protein
MNERLTIQNPHAEILGWLPIGRCEASHGSARAIPGAKWPGVMGAIKGNIGAAAAKRWNGDEKIAIKQKDVAKTGHSSVECRTRRSFSSQRRRPQEDARSSGLAEKDFTFCADRFT